MLRSLVGSEMCIRDREVGSDGASGSFFYFTKDKRYIVKTISLGEKDALVRIARSYLEHVTQYPGTLIHYYGCHSLRLPINSSKMYFCVMKNIFHTDDKLSETYDLKGCTTNRCRLNSSELAEFDECALSRNKLSFKPGTMLDWDWMKLGRKLHFPPGTEEQRSDLLGALHADSEFLARNRLLDYSLLVGMVDKLNSRQSGPGIARGESFVHGQLEEESRCKNMKLSLGNHDFYLGIGDILESWSARWWGQGAVLDGILRYLLCSQWQNPLGITAVPPEQYAARFFWLTADQLLGATPPLLPGQQKVLNTAVGPEMPHLRLGAWW
eukprot:TRINITY_DN19874_c0_g1_i18.p1 TRINITY_DN19874_c0_g1~~TRINITY_DN19874_c0_g1_i18.p1  ORF type:complete len:360 (+),score=79.74 TRINITY_DN19874_c0_g1_i18:106-1080(+)